VVLNIIHGMYRFRNIEAQVRESLAAFRIVSLTGARQVGKTTLVRQICRDTGRRYTTFEDPVTRAAAAVDPSAWLTANPSPLAIDEVQHVPAIFAALKQQVDKNNVPGQYLITGSALWLNMKTIGESLAGRSAILEMFPFTASEWLGRKWEWGVCFGADEPLLNLHVSPANETEQSLWEAVLAGGYPEPAGFVTARSRQIWHESYLRTYLQRDVRDLAHIERMAEFTRLIRLLAIQSGALANQSALARDLGLPQPTVRRYLEWLQITYQAYAVTPYSVNMGKRMVKTPKIYWSDSGGAAALAGFTSRKAVEQAQKSGSLLETWVINDIHSWCKGTGNASLSFWRTHGGGEVDALIEWQNEAVAVEIKAGHRVDRRDLRGLYECRDQLGKRFKRGIVFYSGDTVQGIDTNIIAMPLGLLLGV
jgi:uncharacterized protein